MTQQLLPFPDKSREIYACDMVWGYFRLTGILHLLLLDKMHCPCMCVYSIYFFIYFFVDIFFYYTTKFLSLVGAAFSVLDYVLVVVVGCVLVLWVFQEILVVGVGCIQSQTQTLNPLVPYEKHSNQLT